MQQYLFALLLAAFAGPVQPTPVVKPATGASKSVVSAPAANRRVLTDAQIERNIKARLARSKMSGKERFTVTVQDGVATLEGRTGVIQHKGVATRLARLGGALAVQNHIQISEEAKAKATARLAKYRAAGAGDTPARATVIPGRK
ncbi:MAG: BON domain-containing protein [Acidobacteriota bacterium]